MSSLVFLIPLAIAMGLAGLAIFFWAMRNEQFDDLDGAANRILIDDEDLSRVKTSPEKTAKDSPDTDAKSSREETK